MMKAVMYARTWQKFFKELCKETHHLQLIHITILDLICILPYHSVAEGCNSQSEMTGGQRDSIQHSTTYQFHTCATELDCISAVKFNASNACVNAKQHKQHHTNSKWQTTKAGPITARIATHVRTSYIYIYI